MNDFQNAKLYIAHGISWLGTIVSFQNVEATLRIVALVASIAASLATFWFRRKSKAQEAEK